MESPYADGLRTVLQSKSLDEFEAGRSAFLEQCETLDKTSATQLIDFLPQLADVSPNAYKDLVSLDRFLFMTAAKKRVLRKPSFRYTKQWIEDNKPPQTAPSDNPQQAIQLASRRPLVKLYQCLNRSTPTYLRDRLQHAFNMMRRPPNYTSKLSQLPLRQQERLAIKIQRFYMFYFTARRMYFNRWLRAAPAAFENFIPNTDVGAVLRQRINFPRGPPRQEPEIPHSPCAMEVPQTKSRVWIAVICMALRKIFRRNIGAAFQKVYEWESVETPAEFKEIQLIQLTNSLQKFKERQQVQKHAFAVWKYKSEVDVVEQLREQQRTLEYKTTVHSCLVKVRSIYRQTLISWLRHFHRMAHAKSLQETRRTQALYAVSLTFKRCLKQLWVRKLFRFRMTFEKTSSLRQIGVLTLFENTHRVQLRQYFSDLYAATHKQYLNPPDVECKAMEFEDCRSKEVNQLADFTTQVKLDTALIHQTYLEAQLRSQQLAHERARTDIDNLKVLIQTLTTLTPSFQESQQACRQTNDQLRSRISQYQQRQNELQERCHRLEQAIQDLPENPNVDPLVEENSMLERDLTEMKQRAAVLKQHRAVKESDLKVLRMRSQ